MLIVRTQNFVTYIDQGACARSCSSVSGIEMRHAVNWVHGTPILMSTAFESCKPSEGVGHTHRLQGFARRRQQAHKPPQTQKGQSVPQASGVSESDFVRHTSRAQSDGYRLQNLAAAIRDRVAKTRRESAVCIYLFLYGVFYFY